MLEPVRHNSNRSTACSSEDEKRPSEDGKRSSEDKERLMGGDKPFTFLCKLDFDHHANPGGLREMLRMMNTPDYEGQVVHEHEAAFLERDARLARMDEQGIESCLLFPTLAVCVEQFMTDDVEQMYANFHAFNRWLDETWGFDYQERIYAPPLLSLLDLDEAVALEPDQGLTDGNARHAEAVRELALVEALAAAELTRPDAAPHLLGDEVDGGERGAHRRAGRPAYTVYSLPSDRHRQVGATPGEVAVAGSYETLVVEREGPVGWLINDRPDQLNAMNNAMRDEFADAWLELDRDPAVRVIVHTGNGRAFQTGVDVAEIAGDGVGMERYRQSMEDFDVHFTSWHQGVWKPVITAVNGICCGGGFHWVADADIVIAASDAEFFDPHVSVGQVVAIEAIGLMKKMPVEAVMRMAFMGRHERMGADRARELGMISEIVDPPDRLRERAQELGETIAKNSPAAMAATKKALWGALETGLTEACREGAKHLVSMWGHPDQSEGPAAFAERRDPDWQPLRPDAG